MPHITARGLPVHDAHWLTTLTSPSGNTEEAERSDPAFLGPLRAGRARILSATVRHERGRWFVSFQVETAREIRRVTRPDVAVGIDLGVKTLAVLADSTGEIRTIANPGTSTQRSGICAGPPTSLPTAGPARSRRNGGRRPTRRNKVHHRVANLRTDALHKLTTAVTAEFGSVVVEDLNVAGMLRNRHLARRIADAGFGEIRRQLTYKTLRNGCRVVAADRWFPSSKTCSGCGAVKAKLPLHVRAYECDACGLVIDRNDNAARNLAALAATTAPTGTGVAADQDTAKVSKPRGADHKTRTTRPRRTTGTGRAGGATLPHQRQTEARDRTQAQAPRLR